MSRRAKPGQPGDEGELPRQEATYGLAKDESPEKARAGPSRRNVDAPDARPRRRRRREEDDESSDGEGPWKTALVVASVCCVVALIGMFAAYGTQGPPGTVRGLPVVKLIGFGGLMLLACLFGAFVGVSSVKELSARWAPQTEVVTGPRAIPIGMVHSAIGGFLTGLCLYTIISGLIHR